jgi:sugar phosphate isomerase/epimerase
MFKISGFFDEATGSLQGQIALAKSLGCSYICPRNVDGKNISAYTAEEFAEKIKPRLDTAGITFSSIGSPIGKIALDDDAAYAGQVEKLKELVKIAQMMNCKFIRIFSFFVGKNADYDACLPKVIEKLKGFVKCVEGTDIILLHENEKKIFGDTWERALAVYHGVGSPSLRLCFDASNYIQCGVNPWTAYMATRMFTDYYHMKDCKDGFEVPLGIGDGHIRQILESLLANGYDGFLTMEPHTAKYALIRQLLYFIPFGIFSKPAKVYRFVDKHMRVSAFKSVGREEVFRWQHQRLTAILDELGGKYE